MKTRLVLWGTDANDERVLVAMSLNAEEKKVDIWTFPEQVATETLYNRLFNEWRMGKDIPLPNVFIQIERPLSATEPLLPDDVKVDSPDLVERARTEWQFVILSQRLYNMYHEELEFLRGKVEDLSTFDNAIWEELKGFWEKVQAQIHEKNLFRDHANSLKQQTNHLFAQMKEYRKNLDEEFKTQSKEHLNRFMEILEDVEARIEKGLGLKPLFEELKSIQKEYKATQFTREDRSKVWQKLDAAFKDIKERRFGKAAASDTSALDRLRRRYDGLIRAIQKMEKSIARDKKDMDFQDKRIETTAGQLEEQIRSAKRQMIQGRIESKESKLEEMYKTKEELEKRMAIEEEKAKERKVQEEVEAAKEEVKEKIAGEIREAAAAREDEDEPVKDSEDGKKKKASRGRKSAKGDADEESLASAAAKVIGESVTELADSVKAVAEVVTDRIADALRDLADAAEEE